MHYTCRLNDGTLLETSRHQEPLTITLGDGELIPGIECAILNMVLGDSKTVRIETSDAYGEYRDDLVMTMSREALLEVCFPQIGLELQITQPDGTELRAIITAVTDSHVTLDANHPLAGKTLHVDIMLLDIFPY